jgi:hypothetical protein
MIHALLPFLTERAEKELAFPAPPLSPAALARVKRAVEGVRRHLFGTGEETVLCQVSPNDMSDAELACVAAQLLPELKTKTELVHWVRTMGVEEAGFRYAIALTKQSTL